MKLPVERLLVVSHVDHYRHDGTLYAYGPYAREIDIWADLFPTVLIAAPLRYAAPPADAAAFTRVNIDVLPQLETGGITVQAKLLQILALPVHTWSLASAMMRADALHVRCPGNLGLLGACLGPLLCRYRVAKYAGQWNGRPGEPWSYRLQRRVLGSRWWGGPVTVYGDWPRQPRHVVPFFTSVLTERQTCRARHAVATPKTGGVAPLRVLHVGRLSAEKNVDVLLSSVALLQRGGTPIQCAIVGEGPERARLESLTGRLGLRDSVTFEGGIPFDRVLDFYERSDVLVLASETEGWPKAILEAMAFGVICVGSCRGAVPQMLGDGRGFVVPPGDCDALAGTLRHIAAWPAGVDQMRGRAAAWAQQYTLEGLRDALGRLLAARWRIPVGRWVGPTLAGPGGAP
jgi:hypothetical protein